VEGINEVEEARGGRTRGFLFRFGRLARPGCGKEGRGRVTGDRWQVKQTTAT
jgi:hypothetical protein